MGNNNNKKYNIRVRKENSTVDIAPHPSIHDGSITNSITIDEKCIATCGDDGKLALTDPQLFLKQGQLNTRYLLGHNKAVNRLAFADTNFWSCSRDLSIRKWNIESGQCVYSIEAAHTLNITGIAGNKDHLFSGSRDYSVKGWDATTAQCFFERKESRNIVTCLNCHSVDSSLILQGSEDLFVRIWDIRDSSGRPATVLSGYIYFPVCMDMNVDGYTLATGCKGFDNIGCEVKLWDLRVPSASFRDLRAHGQDVTCCQFLSNKDNGQQQQFLLSASKDGSLIAWASPWDSDLQKGSYQVGNAISSFNILKNAPIIPIPQSENDRRKDTGSGVEQGTTVAIAANDGSLHFVDFNEKFQFRHLHSTSAYNPVIS